MQPELEVMGEVARLLEPLEPVSRARVIAWVVSALSIDTRSADPKIAAGNTMAGALSGAPTPELSDFSTFAELFHAASPAAEKEKALVAAYWIQRSSGLAQFASQQINTELKNIGYGVSNITDALSQLISERPNLVIQVMKSGSTRQARKTYKITDAGMRRVAEMLAGQAAISS